MQNDTFDLGHRDDSGSNNSRLMPTDIFQMKGLVRGLPATLTRIIEAEFGAGL